MKSKKITKSKIFAVEDLVEILELERGKGKSVVLCHGVFDLVHIGHIHHFQQAKSMGDILVVTLTADQYVNKGPHRPAFTEDLRSAAVSALECVDYVAVNRAVSSVEVIGQLRPNVYVKGAEYKDPENDLTNKIGEEEEAVKSVGGQIEFTDDDIVFSSTSLINKHMPVVSADIQEYLTSISDRYSVDEVLCHLDKAAEMKVLLVGETIIDEYEYIEAMGSSSKEPILATRYVSSDKFAGGILAMANHLANFCLDVDLVTVLGSTDTQEEFICQNLKPNVNPKFIYKNLSPTIVKRRYVENYLIRKLFEVYMMDDRELTDAENSQLCATLESMVPNYDVVIVADYGHGMLTEEARDVLSYKSKFLAVNCQANAGNRGFHTIGKYKRADFASLTRYEMALEERYQPGDIKDMAKNLSRKLGDADVMVTLGKLGNLCFSKGEGFTESPALTRQVLDSMGAGDSVLSIVALLMAQQIPLDLIGFVANVVGAEAVATLGHSDSIEKVPLYRHITSYLK